MLFEVEFLEKFVEKHKLKPDNKTPQALQKAVLEYSATLDKVPYRVVQNYCKKMGLKSKCNRKKESMTRAFKTSLRQRYEDVYKQLYNSEPVSESEDSDSESEDS